MRKSQSIVLLFGGSWAILFFLLRLRLVRRPLNDFFTPIRWIMRGLLFFRCPSTQQSLGNCSEAVQIILFSNLRSARRRQKLYRFRVSFFLDARPMTVVLVSLVVQQLVCWSTCYGHRILRWCYNESLPQTPTVDNPTENFSSIRPQIDTTIIRTFKLQAVLVPLFSSIISRFAIPTSNIRINSTIALQETITGAEHGMGARQENYL